MIILANAITRKGKDGEERVPYSGNVTVRAERTTDKGFTFTAIASREWASVEQRVTVHELTVKQGDDVFFQITDGTLSPPGLGVGEQLVSEVIAQAVKEGVEAIGKGRMYLERVLSGVVWQECSARHSKTQSFRTATSSDAERLINQALSS